MTKSFNLVFLACFIFIIGVTLLQAADIQFKSGSKPDGFRGIKWRTSLSSIPDMEYIDARTTFNGQTLEVYRRNSDIMKIGNVDLSTINYIFWKGQLHSIEIRVSGKENFMLFRKELVERYGGDTQNRPLIEMYFWLGNGPNDPIGILAYDDSKEEGVFCLDTGEFYQKFMAVTVE